MALLIVFLGLFPQDAEARVRQLGDDDVAIREAASAALESMGRKALPSLERVAQSGDREVAARAKMLIARIKRNEELKGIIPPTTRVTLKMDRPQLSSLLDALSEQSGYAIRTSPEVRRFKVDSVDFQNTPFFEALDYTVRKFGYAVLGVHRKSGDFVVGSAVIPSSGSPRAQGPVFLQIGSDGRHRRLEIIPLIEPRHTAVCRTDVTILEVRDETGKRVKGHTNGGTFRTVKGGARLPKELSVLRVRVEVIYAVSTQTLRISPTKEAKTEEKHGLRIRSHISRVSRYPGKPTVKLEVTAIRKTEALGRAIDLLRDVRIRGTDPKGNRLLSDMRWAPVLPESHSIHLRHSFGHSSKKITYSASDIGEVAFDVILDSEVVRYDFDLEGVTLWED